MKVSVIVCTKDRPEELARCVESIARQSRIPDETVVVHGGCKRTTPPRLEQVGPVKFKHVYSAAPSYLTADRNKGVRSSSGDIIIFLDDDVILHEDFVMEIARVFEDDADRKIGGAMGQIVNLPRPKFSIRSYGDYSSCQELVTVASNPPARRHMSATAHHREMSSFCRAAVWHTGESCSKTCSLMRGFSTHTSMSTMRISPTECPESTGTYMCQMHDWLTIFLP